MEIETILTPAEFDRLARSSAAHPATGMVSVVFDILRATSSFVTALQAGAAAVFPVREIEDALKLHARQPAWLLAGERDGVKIGGARSGGVDFHLGNSPREFTPAAVAGRTIVSTTTNGTRALQACAGSGTVLAGAFLNLTATADFLLQRPGATVRLVCAGTGADAALEDILAAGALTDLLAARGALRPPFPDATETARRTYLHAQPDFDRVFDDTCNARRLRAIRALADDVAFCRRRDACSVVAVMNPDGALRRA